MTPFYVAEIGGNHGGSLKTALKTIDAAKEAGADAVKFQTWEADTMAIPGYIIPSGPWAGRELLDLYRETHTPWHWHPKLFRHAMDIGILPFSTPFDRPSVALLEDLGCTMYKVASLEINDVMLLSRIGATKKPVLLSTGAASGTEINIAINALQKAGVIDITLLHCVSSYPTELRDANLRRMVAMRSNYRCQAVGLSDHSQGSLVALAATALGAQVIEKHFILNRTMGGPDAAFSMEPHEFKKMVDESKAVASAVYLRIVRPKSDPEESSRLLKRSLYYAGDFNCGHILSLSDFKTARPALGVDPGWIESFIGKPLTRPVKENQPAILTDIP